MSNKKRKAFPTPLSAAKRFISPKYACKHKSLFDIVVLLMAPLLSGGL